MFLVPLSVLAFGIISFNTINGIQQEVQVTQQQSQDAVIETVYEQQTEVPMLAFNPIQ